MAIKSLTDLESEVLAYITRTGNIPGSWVITALEFFDVCTELFNTRLSMQAAPPNLAIIELGFYAHTIELLVSDGGAVLDSSGKIVAAILKAQGAPSTGLLNRLTIGPHTYISGASIGRGQLTPWPGWTSLGSSSGTLTSWSTSPSHAGNLPGVSLADSLLTEPACLCSSHHLATVGHEAGCKWMEWKKS